MHTNNLLEQSQGVAAVGSGGLLASPQRIQLSRKAGWKMPPNTVVVSRPSKWGNPWRVPVDGDQAACVESFKMMLAAGKTPPFALLNIRDELAGKNLACWCKVGTPCHADVLLRLANVES